MPITAPKHGSSAVEILKFKGLAAVASLHFYNMGHEMRSTLRRSLWCDRGSINRLNKVLLSGFLVVY